MHFEYNHVWAEKSLFLYVKCYKGSGLECKVNEIGCLWKFCKSAVEMLVNNNQINIEHKHLNVILVQGGSGT